MKLRALAIAALFAIAVTALLVRISCEPELSVRIESLPPEAEILLEGEKVGWKTPASV